MYMTRRNYSSSRAITRFIIFNKNKKKFSKKSLIIMNMCGRGDKDIYSISEHLGVKINSNVKQNRSKICCS